MYSPNFLKIRISKIFIANKLISQVHYLLPFKFPKWTVLRQWQKTWLLWVSTGEKAEGTGLRTTESEHCQPAVQHRPIWRKLLKGVTQDPSCKWVRGDHEVIRAGPMKLFCITTTHLSKANHTKRKCLQLIQMNQLKTNKEVKASRQTTLPGTSLPACLPTHSSAPVPYTCHNDHICRHLR